MLTNHKGTKVKRPKSKKIMPSQTRHYVFTLNNWTADNDTLLKELGPKVSYLVYGYETAPGTGTPHLQGYIVFPRKKRFSEAQALLPTGAHIESKRGTPQEAADYAKKDGVFQEFGNCPSGTRGSSCFDSFIEWVVSYQSEHGYVPPERLIARHYPQLWLRHERKLRQLALHLSPSPRLLDVMEAELRPWQRNLHNALTILAPDDRTILFYIDTEGGKGKSFFQRYMLTNHPQDVQVFSIAKRDDIAHALDPTKSIFLFNVPRGGMQYFHYTVIEQIKDRMVFSPKYDSTMKILHNNPHVVIFCNEYPDMTKMSADRYSIIDMDTIDLTYEDEILVE